MQYVGAKHEILHFVQDDKSVKYFMLPVVREMAGYFAPNKNSSDNRSKLEQ